MQTSGHVALITGGGSGIGLALAQQFIQNGNRVIVTGRNLNKLEQARQHCPGLETVRADMTDLAQLQQLVRQYPGVNVLVNNAAVQFNYDLPDPTIPLDHIDIELSTNLVGPLRLIKLYLPHLLKHDQAAIVNVSSGLAIVPKQAAPIYCGTKAGLHIYSKALRWQLESTPVKVFEIIPPLVDTAMVQGRGSRKISPEQLAAEFWRAFADDRYEVRVGITKLLFWLNRLAPPLAERIMRPGL